MKVGLIIPTYPYEKRVALLPEHISNFANELIIETGFGKNLDISDKEYQRKGCIISNRDDIFKNCNAIFCLKLLQPEDYPKLRKGQIIVGWTHPTGSGSEFFNKIARTLELIIVDLDNINPSIFYLDSQIRIPWIPRDFIRDNSFIAGISSTLHALVSFGIYPDSNTNVAILAPGNVSQGAFQLIAKFNCKIRLFYRKTMREFYDTLDQYDIIINGIEMDDPHSHILTIEQQRLLKKGTLIIDASADAGNAIEGTKYTSIGDPIYSINGITYYEVNNSPSILYRKSSVIISESMSKWIFPRDFADFYSLLNNN